MGWMSCFLFIGIVRSIQYRNCQSSNQDSLIVDAGSPAAVIPVIGALSLLLPMDSGHLAGKNPSAHRHSFQRVPATQNQCQAQPFASQAQLASGDNNDV